MRTHHALSVLLSLFVLGAVTAGCNGVDSASKNSLTAAEDDSSQSRLPSMSDSTKPSQTSVDLFFYVNADNDLITTDKEGQVIHHGDVTLAAVEALALRIGRSEAGQSVRIHLYYDPNSQISGVENKASLIKRWQGGEIIEERLLGETNSGSPEMLRALLDFEDLGTKKIVFFWSHGNGSLDVPQFDFSEPGNEFNYAAFAEVIKASPVDLVIFDACRMGYLEVLEQFSGAANWLMGSQYDVPIEGVQYEGLARALLEVDAIDLTVEDVDSFVRRVAANLMRETIETQRRIRSLRAPFVLYNLGAVPALSSILDEALKRHLDAAKEPFEELVRLGRLGTPRLRGAFLSDPYASDLRRVIELMRSSGAEEPAAQILEAYKDVSPGGYGSVSFYLSTFTHRSQSS